MTRHCPFCKIALGSYDSYFCSHCGNELSADLIVEGKFQREIIESSEKNKIKHRSLIVVDKSKLPKIKRFVRFFLIYLFIISSVAYLIGYLIRFAHPFLIAKTNSPSGAVVEKPQAIANILNVKVAYSEGKFNSENLVSFAPFNIDLYIEGFDFQKFGSDLMAANINISDDYKNVITDLKDKVNPNFALFIRYSSGKFDLTSVESGLVLIPNDGFTIPMKKYGNLKITNLGKVIGVSENEAVLKELNEVSQGVARNFSQNPVFISTKPLVPEDIQLIVITPTRNGTAYLYQLLNENLPDELKLILNKFLDSKIDYGVILKQK